MEHLTMKELETLLDTVRYYGAVDQEIKAMEELGELIQALGKHMNCPRDDDPETVQAVDDHVAEEMADVLIMLEQLKILMNNHARVDAWTHEKLARLAARIEGGEAR